MDSNAVHNLLAQHLPAAALPYCFQLWADRPFDFKLRKRRLSKVGDFTCHQGRVPRITINRDSHPFLFLVTYVHEVAHLVVYEECGWRVEAHGREWRETFRQLMEPLLNESVFPPALLTVLKKHMIDPKASSFSDTELTLALRQHDHSNRAILLLSDLPEGSTFSFHGKWFKKGTLRRTRVVCRELKTKRNYLVPADAEIDSAAPTLF